jgi:Mn-dependent DtxR family transcriptional regulator
MKNLTDNQKQILVAMSTGLKLNTIKGVSENTGLSRSTVQSTLGALGLGGLVIASSNYSGMYKLTAAGTREAKAIIEEGE